MERYLAGEGLDERMLIDDLETAVARAPSIRSSRCARPPESASTCCWS